MAWVVCSCGAGIPVMHATGGRKKKVRGGLTALEYIDIYIYHIYHIYIDNNLES